MEQHQPKSLFDIAKRNVALRGVQNIRRLGDFWDQRIPCTILPPIIYEMLNILEKTSSALREKKRFSKCKIDISAELKMLGRNRYFSYFHNGKALKFHSRSFWNLNVDIDRMYLILEGVEEHAARRQHAEMIREKRLELLRCMRDRQNDLNRAYGQLCQLDRLESHVRNKREEEAKRKKEEDEEVWCKRRKAMRNGK